MNGTRLNLPEAKASAGACGSSAVPEFGRSCTPATAWASMISAGVLARRHATIAAGWAPPAAAANVVLRWTSVAWSTTPQAPMLWTIARANRPAALGEAPNQQVEPAPADWPAIVTLVGSPPNAAMLRLTHFRAWILSRSP